MKKLAIILASAALFAAGAQAAEYLEKNDMQKARARQFIQRPARRDNFISRVRNNK